MKSIVLLASLLIGSVVGFSQTESSIADSKFRFGFNIGANYSNLNSEETLPNNGKIYNGAGYNFGVFMDYSISKNFLLSPKSELFFNNCGVDFENSSYKIFPVSLNLMIHFVYKIGKGRLVPYFFAGPNLKLPAYKRSESASEFYTNTDFAIDFGVGLENRFRSFIFSPELRYSYGLLNVNANPALRTLNFHNISLVLNFKK